MRQLKKIVGDRVEINTTLYILHFERMFHRVAPEVKTLLPQREYTADRTLRLKYSGTDKLEDVRTEIETTSMWWYNAVPADMYALAMECPGEMPRRVFALGRPYTGLPSGNYYACCEVTKEGLVAKIVSGVERLNPEDAVLLYRH